MRNFSRQLLAFLWLTVTIAARPLASAASDRVTPDLQDKCTFVLWQRQQDTIGYIQLNTILDHANDISIGIASQRSPAAFNSYTRIDEDHAFAVLGLLDDQRLSISYAVQDELAFEVGSVKWTSRDTYGNRREDDEPETAWCNASVWEGSFRRRERRLDCAFPCEKIANEDLEAGYGSALGGGWQRPIVLH
ncbi:hypothetical protein E8E13_005662 [Curvularia kusanoi]|uniref:Uncharacterized protein n=1 Tax=Curvularia kusanoi TaxID=90978 RepID=A0A9P4T7K0_CURKU|nr:hypothetical protein E8E13_005662 [Curvularia kusanoi]